MAGGPIFLGGSDGIVRALDSVDGKVRWTAYTGGEFVSGTTESEARGPGAVDFSRGNPP